MHNDEEIEAWAPVVAMLKQKRHWGGSVIGHRTKKTLLHRWRHSIKIMTTLLRGHCSTLKNSAEGIMLMQIQYYYDNLVLDSKGVCSTIID
jgi:hypothetical protein